MARVSTIPDNREGHKNSDAGQAAMVVLRMAAAAVVVVAAVVAMLKSGSGRIFVAADPRGRFVLLKKIDSVRFGAVVMYLHSAIWGAVVQQLCFSCCVSFV